MRLQPFPRAPGARREKREKRERERERERERRD
jgi:hypothetical protein